MSSVDEDDDEDTVGEEDLPADIHHHTSSSSSSMAQQRPSSESWFKAVSVASVTRPVRSSSSSSAAAAATHPSSVAASSSSSSRRPQTYSIDDLPHSVILQVLNPKYDGEVVTSAECGVRGRTEVYLVDNWAVLLVDRKSPYVSKNAKDFLAMIKALKEKRRNLQIRGAVVCRETDYHRKERVTPFARSTQDFLLEHGVVLLSIPDKAVQEAVENSTTTTASPGSNTAAVQNIDSSSAAMVVHPTAVGPQDPQQQPDNAA